MLSNHSIRASVAVDYSERPISETYRASKVNLNTTPYFFLMKAKAEDALSDIHYESL